jgi:hypothetical protein
MGFANVKHDDDKPFDAVLFLFNDSLVISHTKESKGKLKYKLDAQIPFLDSRLILVATPGKLMVTSS